ncbi:Fe-S protein-like protein [Haloterrigena salina JCM 13891]|uniref:Fe-S protein-like protein n=1 Tax=Haloterrigena salina JCM 13891 TaxID=1227488 RepID=M0BR20_9EURY|nr:MOSC N-terminal beta barrel domain-containing protein [Haloterrigena salina]ELZ13395.1 Fe-S protein-like protein [Haloterrigena salina JCM 13891]
MVHLERIRIRPVASLDAISVSERTLVDRGPAWERRYTIVERTPGSDARPAPVTAEREPRLRRLETTYDLERETVTIRERGSDETATFHLDLDRECFASWLSEFLGYSVEIVRTDESGGPSAAVPSGPTVVSAETLETVAEWYDEIDADELCRRVQPTLVVGGAPPFWEDRLYGRADRIVPVEVGSTTLYGTAPSQLRGLSARDPETGAQTDGFRETFVERRRATLPDWATAVRFDHYFRLLSETRVPQASVGTTLSVDEPVTVGEPVPSPTPAD